MLSNGTGKEYLYFGHYISKDGHYIAKIGTTNDLDRRRKEHNRNYAKTPNYPRETEFFYDWYIKLSKLNTLRYEELNKQRLMVCGFGEYIRNDRFVCAKPPKKVLLRIKKFYKISLDKDFEM